MLIANFLANLAAAVAFGALGFLPYVRKKQDRGKPHARFVFLLLAALGLGLLVVKPLFAVYPRFEARLVPFDAYALVQTDFWLPATFLFLGAASNVIREDHRRALLFTMGVFFLFFVYHTSWKLQARQFYDLVGRPHGGICMQSTGWSCGAAAASTLLHRNGVDATEREMARLSLTEPTKGASFHAVAYALNRKLREQAIGKTARIRTPDPEELDDQPAPFLTGILHKRVIRHLVVVVEIRDREVLVADPLQGLVRMPRGDFLEAWLGVVIVVQ